MKEKATFAAGCFWGVEEKFRTSPGVVETKVGYTGGRAKNPTYTDVCGGGTEHAEAVELVYDKDKTDYEKLVRSFFSMHDPTTVNRQGPDVGDQYRSAVFYHTDEQKEIAERVRDELNESGSVGKIVTKIEPSSDFFDAEEYHQKYIMKKGGGVCYG